jgi:hypothetical protein
MEEGERDSGLKPNAIPGRSRTAFRGEAEHFLANPGIVFGIPGTVFGIPERSERRWTTTRRQSDATARENQLACEEKVHAQIKDVL